MKNQKKSKLVSKDILACPYCGSKDLSAVTGGKDSFLDIFGGTGLDLFDCGHCGREVSAIEFADERDRVVFAKSREDAPKTDEGEIRPATGFARLEFAIGFVFLLFAGLSLVFSGQLLFGIVWLVLAALAIYLYIRTSRKR